MSEAGCLIRDCDGQAAFMPVFQVPDGNGEMMGVAFSLVVCATCKIGITKEQLLTADGRSQIEEAVFAKLGLMIDWDEVTLGWDPIPQPGEGTDVHFEGHYRCSDPAIKHIWVGATDVYNEFTEAGGDDDNDVATRITALAVVVLTEGYKRYRAADPAGGQLFLSSTMRSLVAQLEAQTGDTVKIAVAVTTRDPHAR